MEVVHKIEEAGYGFTVFYSDINELYGKCVEMVEYLNKINNENS